jgi:hypothetical protein
VRYRAISQINSVRKTRKVQHASITYAQSGSRPLAGARVYRERGFRLGVVRHQHVQNRKEAAMENDPSFARELLTLKPVQWSKIQQIEALEPISDADYRVLNEIRDVLLRHGFQDRFGVCLIHKHFDIEDDEIAVEESDETNRVSTIRVMRRDEAEGAMETAWQFDEQEVRAGRNCTMKCKGFGMTGHSPYHECRPT